eukprot:TRINITY_DN2649_c0_g1_i2.p1 TRINITY_DN2649_c0_g1~~TRINITY_DN2649_c0_g1_i2.p1  ORF type:complete len:463 (-),score=167.43 TRINITY_DN2649_c0_g1_i2:2571-3959(-)
MAVEDKKQDGLWRSILQAAAHHGESLDSKNLLLLGDRNCGKTTLLQRFQKNQEESLTKGIALDYSYLNVHDDQTDDVLGRMHVWQLEGEREHTDLLSFALNEENIESSIAVLCVDMSEPWELEEQLMRWIELLSAHINSLRLPSAVQQRCRKAVEDRFLKYAEPSPDHIPRHKASFLSLSKKKEDEASAEHSSVGTDDGPLQDEEELGTGGGGGEGGEMHSQEALPVGVLDSVLEVPVVVIACKSDVIESTLAQEYHISDDMIDYIQQHLRRICIKYGAALVYCSPAKDINCTLAKDYVEHILYGFDFVHKAQVSEREAIFVPIGWDSLEKIQLEFDAQRACNDVDAPFSSVIKRPSKKESETLELADAEDFQAFLEKHKSTIEKIDLVKGNSPAPTSQSLASEPAAPLDTTPTKPRAEPSTPATPTPSSPAGSSASPSVDNPEAIHNFFQNLLGSSASQSK